MGEEITKRRTGVPCLGNIPLMGWLFKSYSRRGDKTNMYVFVTPYVIESVAEAKKIYQEKKEHIERVERGSIKLYERPGAIVPEPPAK